MKINSLLKMAVAIALLSAAQTSFAVEATTSFTGIVPNICSLTATSDGDMTLRADSKALASDHIDGTNGTVTVACNTTGTISVATPVPVDLTVFEGVITSVGTYVRDVNGTDVASNDPTRTSLITSSVSSGIYDVVPYVESTSALPVGDYAVTVVTTLVAD